MVDVIRAKHPDRKYEVDQVRRAVLAHLAEKPPTEGAREMLLAALGELRARMKVEREGDDRAIVTFPPGHRSRPFVVGRIGDDWYLVEFPH